MLLVSGPISRALLHHRLLFIDQIVYHELIDLVIRLIKVIFVVQLDQLLIQSTCGLFFLGGYLFTAIVRILRIYQMLSMSGVTLRNIHQACLLMIIVALVTYLKLH